MLETIGKTYIIDHLIYSLKQTKDKKIYENYVTTALFAISNQFKMKKRYDEISDTAKPEDKRSGDEIAADIIKRAGLKFK